MEREREKERGNVTCGGRGGEGWRGVERGGEGGEGMKK